MKTSKVRKAFLKQYEFLYHGKAYPSIKQCCERLGINYRSVMSYHYEYQCSIELSIDHHVSLKKSKMFFFRNRKWKNVRNCCDFYEINYDSMMSLVYSFGYTTEEAMEHYVQWKEESRILYKGKSYKNLPTCCKEYGIKPGSVRAYARRKSCSITKAISYCIKVKSEREFPYNGKMYVSMPECCREYGINPISVRDRAKRKNCTWEEAVSYYISKKGL